MNKQREVLSALAVTASVAATGLLLGLVWYLVAPAWPFLRVEGGVVPVEPSPEQPVAADGWFTILGLAVGVIAAALVWIVANRTRGPLQMIGLTLGALAAGYVAWQFAIAVTEEDFAQRARQAQVGEVVNRAPELTATNSPVCLPKVDGCFSVRSGELWVPALGAVVGYSLMAGWSRWPSLRREEEKDGQSPQFFEGTGPS